MLRGATVSVDGRGVIRDISVPEKLDAQAGVEFYGGILIPAMVNAHCHLELSALRGKIARGGGLTGFAQAMGGIDRELPERAAAIAFHDGAMWAAGVGAVGDVCNGTSSFAVKSSSRMAYFNFLELFGLGSSSAAALAPVAAAAASAGLRYGLTPHSCYSLGEEAFASAVEATPEEPLSIHFMEDRAEGELFAGRGPLHEWYAEYGRRIDFGHFGSPARRITAQVPASRRTMLVHNTFITEEDIDILAAHFGANLTLALCPRSNLHITGALPPVDMLRRKGVRIALGTDSLASNDSLSLAGEMKCFPGVPLEELLAWATSGGAAALGMDGMGSIEVGKAPGLALLTGADPATGRLDDGATVKRIV